MDLRIPFLALGVVCATADARAQTYAREKPRPHFITVSYDALNTQPLHFARHPLADLTGMDVASVQGEPYDYRTRDGSVSIDVLEFSRRSRGASVSLYPLGMGSGAALMVRGSYGHLPRVRIAFEGPAPLASYDLRDAKALDAGAGVIVADRSPGWGLGSHAFVVGGIGRITSAAGGGRRYFAEAGGGLGVGPFGVELGVKFAWNRLAEPLDHQFLTIPVTLRGTLTF